MKKTIKRIMSASLAVTMLAGLASCGAPKSKFIENQSRDGKSTYYTTEDGKIVVKVWTNITQDSTPEAKQDFEESKARVAAALPNIHIEYIPKQTGTDYRQEYDKDLMAGTAPDFFSAFSYTDIPTRIENGSIADITELVENWDLKKEGVVLDTFDPAISKDGKWYAIPRSAYVQANLYNIKELSARGYDVNNLPKTWDNFSAMGKQVADPENGKFGYELMGMSWCAWPFTVWVWAAGGEMVRENGDGTWSVAFNEPEGVDAAEYIHKMIWEDKMTQKNVLAEMADLNTDMLNGSSVSAFFALDNLINKENIENYGIAMEDYLMTTLPSKDASIERPALAGGEVLTFSPTAAPETIEAAFEYAMYSYYDEEALIESWTRSAELGNINIQMTPRTDLWAKKLEIFGVNQANIDAMLEMQANSKPEPFCPHWTDIKTELVAPLQKIFTTEAMTREDIQAEMDACANKIYELYPENFVKKQ